MKNTYTCPLTAQTYPEGSKVTFHVNGESGKSWTGYLVHSMTGEWKIIAKSPQKRNGEILPIATTGRAVAPQTIRKALA